jgi:hypothetical protein
MFTAGDQPKALNTPVFAEPRRMGLSMGTSLSPELAFTMTGEIPPLSCEAISANCLIEISESPAIFAALNPVVRPQIRTAFNRSEEYRKLR